MNTKAPKKDEKRFLIDLPPDTYKIVKAKAESKRGGSVKTYIEDLVIEHGITLQAEKDNAKKGNKDLHRS